MVLSRVYRRGIERALARGPRVGSPLMITVLHEDDGRCCGLERLQRAAGVN